jgi:hypothetical protein
MKINKILLIAVLLAGLLSNSAWGVESEYKCGKLLISHETGKITYLNDNEPKPMPALKAKKNNYWISNNETIEIYIEDSNRFLYEYNWKNQDKIKIDNLLELDTWLEEIKKLLGEAEGKKTKAAIDESITTQSLTQRSKIEIKIDEMKQYLRVKLEVVNALVILIEKLKKISSTIPQAICTISNDGIKEGAKIIEPWFTGDNPVFDENAINKAYKKNMEINNELLFKIKEITLLNDQELETKLNNLVAYIHLLQNNKDTVDEMINTVKAFKEIWEKMYDRKNKKWIPYHVGTIKYDRGYKLPGTLTIKLKDDLNTSVKRCLTTAAKKKTTGTFEFLFKPYTPLKIKFALGEISSNLKETKEGEEEESNITLTVPMLTITPNFKWWKVSSVKPGLQVGFTIKDKIKNMFFGAGLEVIEKIFLGGGLHARWGGDVEQKLGWYVTATFNILDTKIK